MATGAGTEEVQLRFLGAIVFAASLRLTLSMQRCLIPVSAKAALSSSSQATTALCTRALRATPIT